MTGENVNIVKVDEDTGNFEISQDIIHHTLKSERLFTEALKYLSGLKEAFTGDERAFSPVFEEYIYFPVATSEVHC